jgi:hypothetical protein
MPSLIKSTGVAPSKEEVIDVIGLPGAVAGKGTVTIKGALGEVTATSTDGGSFVASIKAKADEKLAIRYKASEPAKITVPLLGVTAPPKEDLFMSGVPITVPVGGTTTVSGIAGVGAKVLGVNMQSGSTATTQTDNTGRFSYKIDASTGDEIRTYQIDDPLSPPWIQTVP